MEISKIERSASFKKAYRKLPFSIKKKFAKQISFLFQDFRHPSLRVKKMAGEAEIWEARIDRSYRFTFQTTREAIRLLLIGPHDEGLGKR